MSQTLTNERTLLEDELVSQPRQKEKANSNDPVAHGNRQAHRPQVQQRKGQFEEDDGIQA